MINTNSQIHTNENEIDLKDMLKTILQYKWSILSIIILTLVATLYFLYFRVPIYSSNALLEVKSNTQQKIDQGDFLGSAFSKFATEKVDKEIEILKTFHTNNHALNNVYFQIQYYTTDGYKKVELYDNIPITIKNLTIIDEKIVNKLIKLTPIEDGYSIEVQNSLKSKLFHTLFGKNIVSFDDSSTKYTYNKNIKNNYFELDIIKNNELNKPIYFVIKGDNRQIYNTISKDLIITQVSEDAPLIKIQFQDTNPSRSAEYVNALIESFIQQSVADKSKSSNRIIDFINNQLSEIRQKLDKSEDELETYRIENKAIQPTLQGQTYIQELSNIDIKLSQNKLKEKLIIDLVAHSKNKKNLDSMAPSLMELNDQPTLDLIAKLQDAQIKEEGLRSQYSTQHPDLVAVRKQIRYIKNKIVLNVNNLKSSMSHRNKNLKALKNSYDAKLASLPVHERKLINLKRDYEVSSRIYNYLLEKKSENEMIKVAILSDYRIIDRAFNNGLSLNTNPLFILIIAFILGIVLGILQALIRNVFNDQIQGKSDIENLTALPFYGSLPSFNKKAHKLEVFNNPKSPFAESYRSVRTNLQFSTNHEQSNVILITSTIMGEGKSTTSANLAAIFQMANYKTIVINMDLRKPTLHHYFDIDNTLGMSTYLSGKSDPSEIIHSTVHKNLDVIPSGPIPPNPSELILTDKLGKLIEDLKKSYDYIFIDSAPLGLVTDTMHLMQYSDMNLIIFRENYSEKSFVSNLNKLVERHELKNIGLILNDVNISASGYGYGYGYGE